MQFQNFISELKRRNVFKVGTAYAIAGWLIIQVVTSVFPAFNFPEWAAQFVIILVLIGFPISLIIAWAFELTPEGLKKSDQVNITESVTRETGKKLNGIIILVLSVTIIFLLTDRIFLSGSVTMEPEDETSQITSIAVLPFDDLSPMADQEYFSDGISEEILNVLVRIDGINVISRTSSFQFKGRELGIPEIAKELNARYILEGSIRKAGETIRVTAQLIEAETDNHLWSETYDRPLSAENIFRIQDEISAAIVEAMSDILELKDLDKPNVKSTTQDLTAYELFLEARGLFQSRIQLEKAVELLTQATLLDSSYADAYAMMGAVYALIEEYQLEKTPRDRDQLDSLGLANVDKALELDPDNALAYASKGLILMAQNRELRETNDISQILNLLNKALEFDPYNVSAYNWRGLAKVLVRDIEGAIQDFQSCTKIEERYYPCQENIIQAYASVGDDRRALSIYLENFDHGLIRNGRSNLFVLARMGKEDLFKMAANDQNFLQDWNRHDELYQVISEGRDAPEMARDIMNFVQRNQPGIPFNVSLLITALGNYELPYGSYFVWDPALSNYRKTNDFKELIRLRGAYDYWEKFGYPSGCRSLSNNDFECD